MGLEGIDLVLETEAAFGIALTDAEITAARTPRAFIDLVAARVEARPGPSLVVQAMYFDLRRGFRVALGASRVPRLDDALPGLFEPGDWPALWAVVREAAGRDDLPVTCRRPGSFWSGVTTLRDLVWALAIELAPPGGAPRRWTREEVALRVRALIVEQGRCEVSFDETLTWREIGWG